MVYDMTRTVTNSRLSEVLIVSEHGKRYADSIYIYYWNCAQHVENTILLQNINVE